MKSIYIFALVFVSLFTGAQDNQAFFGTGLVNSSSTLYFQMFSVYSKTNYTLPVILYTELEEHAPDKSFLNKELNLTCNTVCNVVDEAGEFTNTVTNLAASDSEIYGHYSVVICKLKIYTVFMAKSFPMINRSAYVLLGFEIDPLETNSSTRKQEGNLLTNEKSIPAVTGNYSNPNKY